MTLLKVIETFKDLIKICFVEENKIFLWFCLCIFESDTVTSDCPMQENYEIFKNLI